MPDTKLYKLSLTNKVFLIKVKAARLLLQKVT